jgi:arylsulfatase A
MCSSPLWWLEEVVMFRNQKSTARSHPAFLQDNSLHIITTLIVIALSLSHSVCHVVAEDLSDKPRRPNIVLILADDLGYGDLGCYGHPSIRTPHLDRMAREGMRFTDFYSAAEVCTPSRAALLTGRYAVRSGMCHDRYRVMRRQSTGCLPAEEFTLAEVLKGQGYATGCIGKWHLGVWSNNPAGHPSRHGFDYFFGLPHSNDMDPAPGLPKGAPARLDQNPAWWQSPLYQGVKLLEQPTDQTMLTHRYTDEAVRFIQDNKAGPFFLYFPHTFPHVPLFASDMFRGKSPRGLYGDVIEELDASVGRVLDAIRAAGIDKNTFVFFTSDNGPWLIEGLAGGSAGLLREGKGSTWEGGMRVPGIAWWPGHVPAGSTCHEIASTMDLFTTGVSWAGAKPPSDRPIDGYDITPLLMGTGTVDRDAYFYYRGTRLFAARLGKWKVHYWTQPGYGTPAPVAQDPPLLFDLQADPGESFNVAIQHPEIVRQITAAVDLHRAQLKPVPSQLEAVTPAKP